MGYPKNAASPEPVRAKVANAANGAPITSGVVVFHYEQDRTKTSGDNDPPTHAANGLWEYTPSQAETNFDTFTIEFYHADAVCDGPQVTVYTEAQTITHEGTNIVVET